MELTRIRALDAPNVWGRVPVLEVRVELGAQMAAASALRPAFEQRLGSWLSGLVPSRTGSSANRSEAELELACEALADALLRATLKLQELSYNPVRFGQIRRMEPAVYHLVVEFEQEKLARACLESAVRFCQAALGTEHFDAAAETDRLRAFAEDVCLGRATGPLVAAARKREIPFRRLDDESLVQLGHGSRQRRIMTSLTENTGKIAEWLSLDKELTKCLLRELGIPVPEGRVVKNADEAWRAACALGLPVAVKPRSADYGDGIGLNLTTRQQVETAFATARKYRDEVLVERFVPGHQYRVTVVGEKMVAANRREPPRLTGDGRQTISQLIDEANRDPRRGDDLRLALTPIEPDHDASQVLAEQGLAMDAVPAPGREVVLSRIAHTWAGAGVKDVTDLVHPRTAAQCVMAARLVGLDVAGLDVVAEDIGRPLEDQGGVILEVNAEPTISFHFPPLGDGYRPVCEAIIESLFPGTQTGRIPLAVVTGCGDRRACGPWLAQLLRWAGKRVGRASGDGIYLDDCRLKPGDHANLAGSRATVLCPQVDVSVMERTLSSLREEGLGFDHIDVAILRQLSCAGDGEILDHPQHLEAARIVVDAAAPDGVLVIDAEDSAAVAMAEAFPGAVFAVRSDPSREPVGSSRRADARFHLRGGDLVLSPRDGTDQTLSLDDRVLRLASDPDCRWGVLTAVAAARAMGLSIDALRTAIHALVSPGW